VAETAGQAGRRSVLVAGVGAVGSVLACLLAESGHRVTALARGDQARALAVGEVVCEGIWGTHRARVAVAEDAEALADSYDAIFFTGKTFHLDALLRVAGPRLAADGVAVACQNGLGSWEKLAEAYGAERTLAARVIFGATVPEPGRVRVTVEAEPVAIGAPAGAPAEAAGRWAGIVDAAGVPCRATDAIHAVLWAKVFYNAALNPMGALLGLSYGELGSDPLRREVMDRVVAEAFAVARAEGVELPWSEVGQWQRLFWETLLPPTSEHRSSMLQDIERGRPTEIDAICGEVVARGQRHGVDVATNRMLLALVRERSRQGRRTAPAGGKEQV
jgi:2-dehydropantoate 2-reductase